MITLTSKKNKFDFHLLGHEHCLSPQEPLRAVSSLPGRVFYKSRAMGCFLRQEAEIESCVSVCLDLPRVGTVMSGAIIQRQEELLMK